MTLVQLPGLETWYGVMDASLIPRILLAAVLGGLIGMEREVSGKPAGLRTNMLICVGAALLMDLSVEVASGANAVNREQGIGFRSDPARIAAQIVSGIGFLGAGTILQARGNVIGLTTAATLWVVAAIGMAVGARAYVEAAGTAALVLASLMVLGRFEHFAQGRWGTHRYVVTMEPRADVLERVESAFHTDGLRVQTSSISKAADRYEVIFVVAGSVKVRERVIRHLVDHDEVHKISREL
jgi:putative Mg2+ transporter-C (MgtC) family protein